jgi:hypothetical protein
MGKVHSKFIGQLSAEAFPLRRQARITRTNGRGHIKTAAEVTLDKARLDGSASALTLGNGFHWGIAALHECARRHGATSGTQSPVEQNRTCISVFHSSNHH